jgi:HTH-type transcriptional regulator/antitoxin HigA
VQLSLLPEANDELWFTLFPELGHVLLLGDDKQLHLNGEAGDAENAANAFAFSAGGPAQ